MSSRHSRFCIGQHSPEACACFASVYGNLPYKRSSCCITHSACSIGKPLTSFACRPDIKHYSIRMKRVIWGISSAWTRRKWRLGSKKLRISADVIGRAYSINVEFVSCLTEIICFWSKSDIAGNNIGYKATVQYDCLIIDRHGQ